MNRTSAVPARFQSVEGISRLALHELFKLGSSQAVQEKHSLMIGSDMARVFERLCLDRAWLDRLVILEEGPIVQIVGHLQSGSVNSDNLRPQYEENKSLEDPLSPGRSAPYGIK